MIEGSAFYGCTGLTAIAIPDSTTSLGDYVFADCTNLSDITLGNGVSNIGHSAFAGCSSLTDITIPSSVVNIEGAAFSECGNLTNIYSKPTIPPTLGVSALERIPSYVKIYVPTASVDAYKYASGWSSHASKITGYDF